MPNHHRRNIDRDVDLINAARAGVLVCTRDHNLNPTFTGPFPIDGTSRAKILKFVLDGVLRYEHTGRYGFGVGRLLPGRALARPGDVKVVAR